MSEAAWLRKIKQRIPEDSWIRRIWRRIRPRFLRPMSPGTRLLYEFGRLYPDAFFIQIGSNDGVNLDPLRAEIAHTRWRGIMVEPVPHIFQRLCINCAGYSDRVAFENTAVADADGEFPFYYLRPVTGTERQTLPVFYDMLGSFNKQVVLSHAPYIPNIDDRLMTTQIRSITFDSLCRKHNVHRVDLLHIDAEGYDYAILKSIDFRRHHPRILIYEHHHLNAADRIKCNKLLSEVGYFVLELGMDSWCLNRRDLAKRDKKLEQHWVSFANSGG